MYSREQLLQIQSAARVYQARADAALAKWGMRAPEPVIGEDPDHYRRKRPRSDRRLFAGGFTSSS